MIKWILASLIVVVLYFTTNKRYRWFYILYKTFPRDVRAAIRFFKLNILLWKWEHDRMSVPKIFNQMVKRHPQKVAFYFEDQSWTFQELDEFSNKIANYFKKYYQHGDSIALLLENRPEYVGIWLGLSKIGVITALINTNLTSTSLAHCIENAKSKGIIFGSSFSNAISTVLDKLDSIQYYQFNDKVGQDVFNNSENLTDLLQSESSYFPSQQIDKISQKDKIVYIYTSGTTGLPKAAVISNIRFMLSTGGINKMTELNSEDVYYNPLPLYHSAGGMVGVGQALLFGITVVLRRKFSATNFWTDCKKYNCTVANYIGEICRYLLNVHKEGTPIDHNVKKMIGNGLRPRIWKKFINTFKIEQMLEFYGATEGNSNIINIDNTVGAVGFVPRYAYLIYPLTLIKCNEITGEPIRNQDGLCINCKPGEPGLILGKIDPKKTISSFAGYADKDATKKKIITNVFRKGDMYFNSGDIVVQDELGYVFFKDRTGDTFRWKGENVATNEIEGVISNVVELKDSIVYGVEIPGTEGRAGMMSIVDSENTLDKDKLLEGLKSNLPAYAIPIFLRILESVPMTGTFKLKKVDLQKDAYDITKIKDPVYFLDTKLSKYVPLTRELYNDIICGNVKL